MKLPYACNPAYPVNRGSRIAIEANLGYMVIDLDSESLSE